MSRVTRGRWHFERCHGGSTHPSVIGWKYEKEETEMVAQQIG